MVRRERTEIFGLPVVAFAVVTFTLPSCLATKREMPDVVDGAGHGEVAGDSGDVALVSEVGNLGDVEFDGAAEAEAGNSGSETVADLSVTEDGQTFEDSGDEPDLADSPPSPKDSAYIDLAGLPDLNDLASSTEVADSFDGGPSDGDKFGDGQPDTLAPLDAADSTAGPDISPADVVWVGDVLGDGSDSATCGPGSPDADGDGSPDCAEGAAGCPPGAASDAAVFPGYKEVCDGKDNDCNGVTDEPCPASSCGNDSCDMEETPWSCAADCAWLWQRLAGSCSPAGTKAGCPVGYVCVARNLVAGGSVCVSDMRSWPPLPDSRPPADFVTEGETAIDGKTGLQWPVVPLQAMDWAAAKTACTTQTYNSFKDWRLPTRTELISLLDRTKEKPASTAPLNWPTDTWAYWTASPGGNVAEAWNLGLHAATSGYATLAGTKYRVRCVRSAGQAKQPAAKGVRYQVSPDGLTVFDHASGLRWQRSLMPNAMIWKSADSYCKGNTAKLAGAAWRMPLQDELLTIANLEVGNPAVDLAAFPGTPGETFWSASPRGAYSYRTVLFSDGGMYFDAPVSSYRVRCVR